MEGPHLKVWGRKRVLYLREQREARQNKAVSRDGERLQRRDRHRLKALTLSFQTVPVSSLEAFTISRYGISVTKIFPRLRKVLYRRIILCSFKRAHSRCPIILFPVFFNEISREMSHLVSDNSRGRLRSVGFSRIANSLFPNLTVTNSY